jgi:site-specific recombinase XerD
MRITISGSRVDLQTKILVEPEKWNNDSQKIKGDDPLVREYNDTLLALASKAWSYFNDALKRKEIITPIGVKNFILNKDQPKQGLLESFDFHIGNLQLRVGLDVAPRTLNNYFSVKRKLEVFLPIKYNTQDIALSSLNKDIVADFDLYLRKKGLKHNAVIKNMQNFRSLLKICIKNGWLEKDPFVFYSFRLDDTERGYLSPNELAIMEGFNFTSERLQHVRDIFVFCCYTGLAYADVSKLNKSHVEESEDGITWIKLNRTKTKSRSVIPLLPRAREILDKYSSWAKTDPEKKLLPVISNQNLNKYLKEVAELCGISKRVSMLSRRNNNEHWGTISICTGRQEYFS